jgi:hypothetical protein
MRNLERGAVISPPFSSDVLLFCFIIWDGVSLIKFRVGKEVEIARKPLLQLP